MDYLAELEAIALEMNELRQKLDRMDLEDLNELTDKLRELVRRMRAATEAVRKA